MCRQPIIYKVNTIMHWVNMKECRTTSLNGIIWNPARPLGHNLFSIVWRWKLAFLVLIGKYDALNWEGS